MAHCDGIVMSEDKIRCSVGVTAYNEEANIGRLIEALIEQRWYQVQMGEIMVVASGGSYRTVQIVRWVVAVVPRIRLRF